MNLPELNETELDVLKIFWSEGSLSAREYHQNCGQSWSYSTARTVLERMSKKGLLKKESFHGLYIYKPTISKAAGLARFVHDFARNVLETEYSPVVNLFAQSKALTDEELVDLTRILDEAEEQEP